MKKGILLSVLAAGLFLCTEVSAQSQGDFRASLGLAGGTKASVDTDTGDDKFGLGVNAGVEYFLIDNLSLAPSFTYFLPVKEGGVTYGRGSLNFDARYYFVESFYATAGYASFSSRASGGGASVSVNEGAYNIGAGTMLPLGDALNLNLQVKYQSILDSDIDFNQIVAQAGVVFSF